MRIHDLLERCRSEPEQTRRVRSLKIPPQMLAKIHQGGGVSLADLLAAQKPEMEFRDVRYRHILGPPASEAAITAWQAKHPSHTLPTDLLDLVRKIDGIHLWANADTGRAGTGVAPIEEWDIARFKMHGPHAPLNPHFDDRYVAITYDVNGGSYVVVDTTTGNYYQVEASGPDPSSPIAANVEHLLDWLWARRVLPSELP